MPHFGRTRMSSQVSRLPRRTSTAVVAPSWTAQRTQPSVSPILISNSMSIHLFCSGTRSAEPITTPEFSTLSSIFWMPLYRRSEVVRIGSVPVPGCFICMMWVTVVVGLHEDVRLAGRVRVGPVVLDRLEGGQAVGGRVGPPLRLPDRGRQRGDVHRGHGRLPGARGGVPRGEGRAGDQRADRGGAGRTQEIPPGWHRDAPRGQGCSGRAGGRGPARAAARLR